MSLPSKTKSQAGAQKVGKANVLGGAGIDFEMTPFQIQGVIRVAGLAR
jgi:hypothetical protein